MEATFKVKVLNEDRSESSLSIVSNTKEAGSDLIKELKIALTNLKGNFMDEETGKVNYGKMLESEEFAAYRR